METSRRAGRDPISGSEIRDRYDVMCIYVYCTFTCMFPTANCWSSHFVLYAGIPPMSGSRRASSPERTCRLSTV